MVVSHLLALVELIAAIFAAHQRRALHGVVAVGVAAGLGRLPVGGRGRSCPRDR